MKNLEEIRQRYIKKERFLEQQVEVLECLLDQENQCNILYMAPAARGKTLAPLIATLENKRKKPKKMTLWFVPTIALAHDLMKRIDKNGNYRKLLSKVKNINYQCFTGEDVIDKANKKVLIARTGDPDMLIVSPENLKDPAFLAWLLDDEDRNIGLIVLDEAHLFDEWGITFRRAYFIISWLIKTLREQNNNFKVLALSASLPEEKRQVVMKMLHFNENDTLISRPKALFIGPKIICQPTRSKTEKTTKLIRILRSRLNKKNMKARGVLFSPYKAEEARGQRLEWSIKNIEKNIVPYLNLKNGEYALYTGSTQTDERGRILHDLQNTKGKIRLLLATSAFGFGVDINNLDFSVHVEVPEDLDRFYQEISRCSRVPKHGAAYLFYSPHEVAVQTKRCMATFKYETVKDYLEYLGIKNIRKGNKTLSIRKVLKKSNKDYSNGNRAQMSANSYCDHAFEAIMFLYRKNIIDLRPLRENNFPKKRCILRRAFENGRSGGYRKVPYKKYNVFLPSVKFPIRILKNMYWPEIEKLVNEDKSLRGKRTDVFKKTGRNTLCHWRIIANHYNIPMQNQKHKIVTQCNHCNVCK